MWHILLFKIVKSVIVSLWSHKGGRITTLQNFQKYGKISSNLSGKCQLGDFLLKKLSKLVTFSSKTIVSDKMNSKG